MHKELLEALEEIQAKNITYKKLYICQHGKNINRGLPLHEIYLAGLKTSYPLGFDLAIIHESDTVIPFDFKYPLVAKNDGDYRLKPAYAHETISYFRIT